MKLGRIVTIIKCKKCGTVLPVEFNGTIEEFIEQIGISRIDHKCKIIKNWILSEIYK